MCEMCVGNQFTCISELSTSRILIRSILDYRKKREPADEVQRRVQIGGGAPNHLDHEKTSLIERPSPSAGLINSLYHVCVNIL